VGSGRAIIRAVIKDDAVADAINAHDTEFARSTATFA
jgi:hypothetical protein